MKYILIFFLLSSSNILFAKNNYYDIKFSKEDISKIKKKFVYETGIFKDTQTKPVQYEDKIIYLDGYKNLRIFSLVSEKEFCVNQGQKDRGYHRGIGIYKKNDEEIFAVFVRQSIITLVNIFNCEEEFLKKTIKIKETVSAPILIKENIAYILINGSAPKAYDLSSGNIIWEANIEKKVLSKLKYQNLNKEIKWDVWGGGVIDKKYNQLIFSTANAKPSWSSDNRLGPNLFYNSVVSVDLDTGKYNWHFQEIEHDLWNLDMAAPPILLNFDQIDYVAQATKSGQLITLMRKNGKPTEEVLEKKFDLNDQNEKTFTIKRYFPSWLTYSRNNFTHDDINNLNKKFSKEAIKVISESMIGDTLPLSKGKNYIYYGIHGGTQWPGIAATPGGIVIIPSNNIAYRVKLKDPDDFDFKKEFKALGSDLLNIKFNNYKSFKYTVKKVLKRKDKILDYKKTNIEGWNRFENAEGIPLNRPPWGILTAIDLKNKKILWKIPHGSYEKLKDKGFEQNTGSEIFGSPVITSGGVIFIAGTDDRMIRGYDLYSGEKIWQDKLPFSSYGSLIIASYKSIDYLVVNSSSGSKFDSERGDSIIIYQLN